jgi:hypothetical protein
VVYDADDGMLHLPCTHYDAGRLFTATPSTARDALTPPHLRTVNPESHE